MLITYCVEPLISRHYIKETDLSEAIEPNEFSLLASDIAHLDQAVDAFLASPTLFKMEQHVTRFYMSMKLFFNALGGFNAV